MPSYKNTANTAILGIEPGQTGELDEETVVGFVGPGALEPAGEVTPTEDAPVEPPEDAPVSLPKPIRGPVGPAE